VALIYPDGKTVAYTYDLLDRLVKVADWDSNVVTYTYNVAGSLIGIYRPNGVVSSYEYDEGGRLQALSYEKDDKVISSYQYVYDNVGNRTSVDETIPFRMVLLPYVLKQSSAEGDPYPDPLRSEPPSESIEKPTPTPNAYPAPKYEISSGGFSIWESVVDFFSGLLAWFTPAASAHAELPKVETSLPAVLETTIDVEGRVYTETIQYDYDPLYRLTNAIYSSGAAFTYTYDQVGNRQSLETHGETTTYLYDNANRLTHVNGITYTWDDNGNLINDGLYTYTYNAFNRLVAISNPHVSIGYEYNGLGDRYSLTVGGERTDYALDQASRLTQIADFTCGLKNLRMSIVPCWNIQAVLYSYKSLDML